MKQKLINYIIENLKEHLDYSIYDILENYSVENNYRKDETKKYPTEVLFVYEFKQLEKIKLNSFDLFFKMLLDIHFLENK